MSFELLYTSAPKGLKPGSRGFCTVVCTSGLSPTLQERLESLSGYSRLFPPGHPQEASNPVVYSHIRIPDRQTQNSVLTRNSTAALDYSNRTNNIAHHVVLTQSEKSPAGPAWILGQPQVMTSVWNGEVQLLKKGPVIPNGNVQPGVARNWQQMTGDAGWAGVLAETAIKDPSRIVLLLFEAGQELLPLFAEAIALMPPAKRWDVTFSTYYKGFPQDVRCAWRGLLKGAPEESAARRQPNVLVIDLTGPEGTPHESPLVETARTGRIAAPAAVAAPPVPPPITPPALDPAQVKPPLPTEEESYGIRDENVDDALWDEDSSAKELNYGRDIPPQLPPATTASHDSSNVSFPGGRTGLAVAVVLLLSVVTFAGVSFLKSPTKDNNAGNGGGSGGHSQQAGGNPQGGGNVGGGGKVGTTPAGGSGETTPNDAPESTVLELVEGKPYRTTKVLELLPGDLSQEADNSSIVLQHMYVKQKESKEGDGGVGTFVVILPRGEGRGIFDLTIKVSLKVGSDAKDHIFKAPAKVKRTRAWLRVRDKDKKRHPWLRDVKASIDGQSFPKLLPYPNLISDGKEERQLQFKQSDDGKWLYDLVLDGLEDNKGTKTGNPKEGSSQVKSSRLIELLTKRPGDLKVGWYEFLTLDGQNRLAPRLLSVREIEMFDFYRHPKVTALRVIESNNSTWFLTMGKTQDDDLLKISDQLDCAKRNAFDIQVKDARFGWQLRPSVIQVAENAVLILNAPYDFRWKRENSQSNQGVAADIPIEAHIPKTIASDSEIATSIKWRLFLLDEPGDKNAMNGWAARELTRMSDPDIPGPVAYQFGWKAGQQDEPNAPVQTAEMQQVTFNFEVRDSELKVSIAGPFEQWKGLYRDKAEKLKELKRGQSDNDKSAISKLAKEVFLMKKVVGDISGDKKPRGLSVVAIGYSQLEGPIRPTDEATRETVYAATFIAGPKTVTLETIGREHPDWFLGLPKNFQNSGKLK